MTFAQQMSAYDKVLARIDEVTEPSRMSSSDADDFLSALIDDLKMRLEALREEQADRTTSPTKETP